MKPRELEVGDVVQLDPAIKDKRFAACLMVVTEPKQWGAQGCIVSPHEGEAVLFFYRAKFEDMEHVGRAAWIRA